MEKNQSMCVHVLEQRGPSNDKYCIHYWEVWTKEKTLSRETRCGGHVPISSQLEEWQLKVPKWPRSLECYFPVLVIWGFDHMFLVTPKMFSSGFKAREMRSLLGEALAIFVACCSSLWSHYGTLNPSLVCSRFRMWLWGVFKRTEKSFFYDWDCFLTKWY